MYYGSKIRLLIGSVKGRGGVNERRFALGWRVREREIDFAKGEGTFFLLSSF